MPRNPRYATEKEKETVDAAIDAALDGRVGTVSHYRSDRAREWTLQLVLRTARRRGVRVSCRSDGRRMLVRRFDPVSNGGVGSESVGGSG